MNVPSSDYLHASMRQQRMLNIELLSIECQILESLNIYNTIFDFVRLKSCSA